MSDRVKGFVVALERDLRDDDCEAISNAILHIRGVTKVTNKLVNPDDFINRAQIQREMGDKLFHVIYPQAPK